MVITNEFSVFFIEYIKNLNKLIDLYKLKDSMLKDFFKLAKDLTNEPNMLIDFLSNLTKKYPRDFSKDTIKHTENLKRGMTGDNENKFSYEFFLEVNKSFNYKSYNKYERMADLILRITEFEKYLSSCFKYVILKRPEIYGKKLVKIEEIKLLTKIDIKIIEELGAEHYIQDLFYNPYQKLFERAKNPIGINHNVTTELINLIYFAKLIRNQYVHADGNVTMFFLIKLNEFKGAAQKLSLDKLTLNDEIKLSDELLKEITFNLIMVAIIFDEKLTEIYPDLIFKLGT